VHWLRARAQKNRWFEEFTLVKYEMEWTSRFFFKKAAVWKKRAQDPLSYAGARSYAARQAFNWTRLAADGERLFGSVNSDYVVCGNLFT
jgi:hypothetical protein